MHTYVHTYTYTHTHTHTHTYCIYIYIYIHTHTHTHTYMTEFAKARQGPPGKEMALQGPGGPSESRFMQQVGLVFTSYDMHVSSSSYDMHVSSSSYDMHVSSSSYDMHPRDVCSRLDMCSHVCSHVF
jgi:hypothetical protein